MTECIILAGGLGTRLRPILGDVIKPMVRVEGKPFLQILVEYVHSFGIQRFTLAVGTGSDQIESYFGSGERFGVTIRYSVESKQLLGTGGAVRQALEYAESDHVLVLNGDSLCLLDYNEMEKYHQSRKKPVTIAGVVVEDASRFGNIALNDDGSLVRFEHKREAKKEGIINAGVYIMNKAHFLESTSLEPFSLEKDYFEKISTDQISVMVTRKPFIDFGVPKALEELPRFVKLHLS